MRAFALRLNFQPKQPVQRFVCSCARERLTCVSQSMLRASSSPPPPMTWPLLKGPYNSLASSYLSTYLLLASSLPAAAADVGAALRCWSYWRAGVKRIGILIMTTNYYKCLLSGKFVLSFLILSYLYKHNLSMIRRQKSCQCLSSSKNQDTRRC